MAEIKIVMVKWLDAINLGDKDQQWSLRDKIKDEAKQRWGQTVTTVGILIEETSEYMIFAGDYAEGDDHVANCSLVPKVLIKSQRILWQSRNRK